MLTRLSSSKRWTDALAGIDAALVVAGHTHQQDDRVAGGVRFLNAGSVGLPYEGDGAARWLWVADGVPELRQTAYNARRAGEHMLAAGWPDELRQGGACRARRGERCDPDLRGAHRRLGQAPPALAGEDLRTRVVEKFVVDSLPQPRPDLVLQRRDGWSASGRRPTRSGHPATDVTLSIRPLDVPLAGVKATRRRVNASS
jgi:hypothetical protein